MENISSRSFYVKLGEHIMEEAILTSIASGITAITVAFIGIIPVLITARREKAKTSYIPTVFNGQKSSMGRLTMVVVICLLVGGLLGYFFVTPALASSCFFFQRNDVGITRPASGASVPEVLHVQGTSCHISDGEQLWLLVEDGPTSDSYPQDGPITVLNDGTWSVTAYIGAPSDVGAEFFLVPALANQKGSVAIQSYLKRDPEETTPFKLTPDSQDIQLLHQVRVIRQ